MTHPEVKPGSPIIEMDAFVLDPDSNNHISIAPTHYKATPRQPARALTLLHQVRPATTKLILKPLA